MSVAFHGNRGAFLDTIAASEIGYEIMSKSDNGYNVLVGSTPNNILTFPSYETHPHILNKDLNSTAAGRYQLLYRYYQVYSPLLDLDDFSPKSQDEIAIQQISECRALKDIDDGNFESAIKKVSHIWASLPYAQYNQHVNSLASLKEAYLKAGGQSSS